MGQLVWRCLLFSGSRQSQEKCCFRQLVVQGCVSHLVAFSFSHKPLSLVCGSIHHKPVLSCKVLSLLKIVCPLGFGAGLHGLGYLVLDLMRHAFLESIIKGDAVALFLWPQASVALLHISWSVPVPEPFWPDFVFRLFPLCFLRLSAEVFPFHGFFAMCILPWH